MNVKSTSRMTPPLFRLLLAALLFVGVAALPARAQETPQNGEATASVNAEARTQFGEVLTAANELAAKGTVSDFVKAAQEYMKAAQIAASSGDAELESRAKSAHEAAVGAHMNAGAAYAAQNQYAEAAAQFEAAAQVSKELANAEFESKAWYNAGTMMVSLEKHPDAVVAFTKAVTLAPENLDYQFAQAVAYRSAGDAAKADATFKSLMEKAKTQAESATDPSAKQEAEALVSKVQETVGRGYLIAANNAVKEGKFSAAIKSLDQASDYMDASDPTLNALYANAYYRWGVQLGKSVDAANPNAGTVNTAISYLDKARSYGAKAGQSKIVDAAQQYLDYLSKLKK